MATEQNKTWRMGEENPETGLIFWAYQDKAHKRTVWLTKEKFAERRKKSYEYQNSRYETYHKKRYYENHESELEKRRNSWKRRIEENPISMLMYCIRGNARNKRISISVTADDIAAQLEKQNGLCYYTGVRLVQKWKQNSPYQISVDRVDSNGGYDKENIVLCCQAINFMKADYPIEIFKEFLQEIAASQFAAPQAVKWGEWQLCPKCDGSGQIFSHQTTSIFKTCDVCNGAKIIQRPIVEGSTDKNENPLKSTQ